MVNRYILKIVVPYLVTRPSVSIGKAYPVEVDESISGYETQTHCSLLGANQFSDIELIKPTPFRLSTGIFAVTTDGGDAQLAGTLHYASLAILRRIRIIAS